jgi:hypothetical protein
MGLTAASVVDIYTSRESAEQKMLMQQPTISPRILQPEDRLQIYARASTFIFIFEKPQHVLF